MQWFSLRPTFEIAVADSQQEAVRKIRQAYEQEADRKLTQLFGDYGELHLPTSEHRIWSPHLSFSIEQRGEQALIHGRFAPRFEIWTFVWIGYMAFGFSAFFGFILGFSQFMIRTYSWGTWIGLVALLLWTGLIVIAHIGQEWSADQMHALKHRLDDLLARAQVTRQE